MNNKLKWVYFLLIMLALIVVGNAVFQAFFAGTAIYVFAAVWGIVLGLFFANPLRDWLGIGRDDS